MNIFDLLLEISKPKDHEFGPFFWFCASILVILLISPWIVVVFLWIFKRYRVRFFGFHGEVISCKYYKKNSLFELPTDTTIPGYTFDGWYEDAECEYPLSFSYVGERNLKIYGKWIKNSDEV